MVLSLQKRAQILISLKQNSNIQILGINFKDKKNNALGFLNELGNPYYFQDQIQMEGFL